MYDGLTVPMPTLPPFAIVKYVEVEVNESDEVPILNVPSMFERSQCLALVPSDGFVIAKYGVDDATCRDQFGVVVPMPKLPEIY